MKYLILLLCIVINAHAYSQCEYSMVNYDATTGQSILKSKLITLDFQETPYNGRIVLAKLVRSGNQYFVELEITEDSSTRDIEAACIEPGSRLSFSLKNGLSVSLFQVNEKMCGIKTENRKTDFTSISNYGYFVITQNAFDELVKSEILIMKITSKDYNKTLVLKEELEIPTEEDYVITNPSRFFMDNIDCLINPKFK